MQAIYFSRSPIPFPREKVLKFGSLEKALENDVKLVNLYRKHTGLYVYKRNFLLQYTKDRQTELENTEMLEQLRILENGEEIKVIEVEEKSVGVDTKEDYLAVRELVEGSK